MVRIHIVGVCRRFKFPTVIPLLYLSALLTLLHYLLSSGESLLRTLIILR